MHTFLVFVSFFINSFEDPFIFTGIIAASALLVAHYNRTRAVEFFVSFIFSFGTGLLLKEIFKIPRPIDALATLDTYRFPSMHAIIASTLATSFVWYVWETHQSKMIRTSATAFAIALVLFISYTRLVLHVHEPIDVMVGVALGLSITLCVHALVSRYK